MNLKKFISIFHPKDWKFENKLILMVLFLSFLPLIGYAFFSLNNFRKNSISYAERDIEHIVKSMIMLCEAQEALDRLKIESDHGIDVVTAASPSWRDGNEFKSLRSIIKNIKIAETGYCHVFDSSGLIVIHPYLENRNVFKIDQPGSEYLVKIRNRAITLSMGTLETIKYPWFDERTGKTKIKIAKFGYFQPYDWVIVGACFEDEILQPYYEGMRTFAYIILGTTFFVIFLVFTISRYMMRPIRQLTEASTHLAKGDFNVKLPVGSRDEIGTMATSFSVMVEKLGRAHEDLIEWSKTLEQKVEERTLELKNAHEKMLTAEKMASLGKLSAMVAHEINNPLSGVLSYLRLSMKLLDKKPVAIDSIDAINRYLDLSATEVKRVGEIVKNLLMFAKKSFGEFVEEHFNNIINKSVALVNHTLHVNDMTLKLELDKGGSGNDMIFCDSSGLQQMLMALMVNAIEAMNRGGVLTIKTDFSQEKTIQVQVMDTGKGIPEDVLPHIFEPFFSHKDSPKSIGMGLSVVYGIVQSHEGRVKVESKIDEGTKFIIDLPRHPVRTEKDETT